MKTTIIALLLIVSGCGTMESLTSPPFHEIVEIENVFVHVVSDPAYFGANQAWTKSIDPAKKTWQGFFDKSALDIYVLGYWDDGEIVPYQCTFGHEMQHYLRFKNKIFKNPDKK